MSQLSRTKLAPPGSPSSLRQLKEEEEWAKYSNIMFDRRVVRGNTYALPLLPNCEVKQPSRQQRKVPSKKSRLASPPAVEGRLHIEVQTELYLEELSERVEEVEAQIQTDAFIDRPQSPMFVPAKTGMDEATQIYEGDLFDFDIEVVPVLQVLVGKTIEQSLLEVMEEEELADLREQQRRFEELRNAELVEQQRLEEQDRRHQQEKENRMRQQQAILQLEKETARKIAAQALARSYLTDLVPSVFGSLRQNGYFYDPVERELERVCVPVLMNTVINKLDLMEIGRQMMDNIIINVCRDKDVKPDVEVHKESPPPSIPAENVEQIELLDKAEDLPEKVTVAEVDNHEVEE